MKQRRTLSYKLGQTYDYLVDCIEDTHKPMGPKDDPILDDESPKLAEEKHSTRRGEGQAMTQGSQAARPE